MKKQLLILFYSLFLISCSAILHNTDHTKEILKKGRSLKIQQHDHNIEQEIQLKLTANPLIDHKSRINVSAYNGIVLLTGQTPTVNLLKEVISTTQQVNYIKKIHNQLTIASPISLSTQSQDRKITTKIENELQKITHISGFNAKHIKVITENGNVFLTGILYENEAHIATEIARREHGVKKVIKLFKIYKPK